MKRFILNILAVLGSGFLLFWGTDCGAESQEDKIIAILNGKPIYQSEVEQNVAFRLYRLRGNIYTLLQKETEDVVNQRLLEAEARRQGISIEALLKKEVDEKAPLVDEKEVDQYLNEHGHEPVSDSNQRNRIRTFLFQQALSQRKNDFIAALQKKADYKFLLEMPERPRMRINIEGEPWRGNPDAPVILVHISSFSCPICAQSARMIKQAMEEFPGQIKWVHRNDFNIFNEKALTAAQIGEFAFERGKFWEFHDRAMVLEGQFEPEQLFQITKELGLDRKDYDRREKEGRLLLAVKKDIHDATNYGVTATPVIFVNGLYFHGTFPYDQLKARIIKELDEVQKQQ